MPLLADRALDAALDVVRTEASRLYICSQEPTSYAEASATYALGNKNAPTIGAVGDRTGGGRKVTVAQITDGSVTANGTASHYALVDVTNSRLLVANSLAASQAVTSGNTFTLAAFDVGLTDPA